MKNSLRVRRLACAVIGLACIALVGPAEGVDKGVNHYILGCDSACANFNGPVITGNIDPTFTGSWYDPTQSGHGLSLEILPDHRLLVLWFTFNPDGTQQSWLVGTGTYTDNVATIPSVLMPAGGRWMPNFDPRQVVNNAWGTMKMTFTDSDHGKVEFISTLGYGAGSMNLTRLTRPAGITAAAMSASGKSWVLTGNLNVPRSGHSATLLMDGRVLVAGGWSPTDVILDSTELYDSVTGKWTSTGSLTRPRGGHTATLLPGGKVLVIGGGGTAHSDPTGEVLGSAELYDPATGIWSPTGSLNTPRASFTATLLDTGKVLVAGGIDNADDGLASAELYDPAMGIWSFTGGLRNGRFHHTASALTDGRVLVTGGWLEDTSQRTTDTVELYDPVAGVWSSTAPLNGARVFHTATTLKNGNVVVAGGYNSYPPGGSLVYVPMSFSDAQIYDASTGKWIEAGSMNVAREGHSATRLPDGRVLVAGGYDSNLRQIAANAEVFDPVTGIWSDGGSFDLALAGNTATLLQNGNVLIAGGGGSANAPVTAEIYANVPISAGAGMTGSWYDPAQSGHGLIVEALPGNRMLATWFAFNPAGTQQSWFLGVGGVSGNTATITSVLQPNGGRFIPNFDSSRIVNNAWGTLTFTFIDCDHGNVDFASTAGYGTGSMNLTRLTWPAGLACP